MIASDRPALNGGIQYLNTGRNSVYVNQKAYRQYRAKVGKRMGWRDLRPGQFEPVTASQPAAASTGVRS